MKYLSTHPPALCTTNTVCLPPLLRGLVYYRASKERSHRCFWCNTRIRYIPRLYARKPRAKATGNVNCGTRRIGRFRVPRPSWRTTQQHATPVPRARHWRTLSLFSLRVAKSGYVSQLRFHCRSSKPQWRDSFPARTTELYTPVLLSVRVLLCGQAEKRAPTTRAAPSP